MYYISSFFLFFFFFKDDCQRLVGGAGASLLTGAIHFVIFRRPESFFAQKGGIIFLFWIFFLPVCAQVAEDE